MLQFHMLQRVHTCGGEKNLNNGGVTSETSNGTNTRNQNETVVDRGQSWWVEERVGDQLGDHKALNLGLEVFIFTEEHIWLLPLTLGL